MHGAAGACDAGPVTVFAVDDVTPVLGRLPSRLRSEITGEVLALGGDPNLPLLEPDGVQPLLSAVGKAFAEHRPLVLSPDAVWLTILQGLAQHIRLHAEQLRPRLVGHEGRERLEVVTDRMPGNSGEWATVVERISRLLAGGIRDAGDLECDFTTSTSVERTAGQVVLLDAYSPYFSYWLVCICGIPSITLTGTPDDWRGIQERVPVLESYGLEDWCRSLTPIIGEFVRSAEGNANVAFWKRIYNPADAYGGHVITGWAARLYPYLTVSGVPGKPNPLLDLPIGEPRDLTVGDGYPGYQGPGITSDSVPAVLSKATVNVSNRAAGDNTRVSLHAGLVGVTQQADGALRPVAGWHVAEARPDLNEVVERLIEDYGAVPPDRDERPGDECPGVYPDGPPEVAILADRIGSASLFGGTWRMLSAREYREAWLEGTDWMALSVIDLPGGRSIAGAFEIFSRTARWVICRTTETGGRGMWSRVRQSTLDDDPADVPVYGTSLAMLLEAALDSGGDISLLETGRLSDLL